MSFKVNYSFLDKLLHKLAFRGLGLQKSLSEIEDEIFASGINPLEVKQPVFIASLPRAGTTLMLEVIVRTGSFATHTYREMPFLLCPLLWSKMSRPFRKQGGARERAHGDGMIIDFDSPEAFEEVLWYAFWPMHYKVDRIKPWAPEEKDVHDEFEPFLRNHIRKLILLHRAGHDDQPRRYISKNNGNLARLSKLLKMFPDATVVVPFRTPIDYVGSLLRQHKIFLAMHREDPFALRYMSDIGHFEFGATLKPIDLGGWLDAAEYRDPHGLDFWLSYWIVVFEHVLAQAGRVVLVSYDRLCAAPAAGLDRLASVLRLGDPNSLVAQADLFRRPKSYETDRQQASPTLMKKAEHVYQRLSMAAAI